MDPMQAIANLQAQNAQFQSQITHLQSEIQVLRSSINSTPTRPKPSLPDPEKFNGQSHKFDTWLPSIKAKLRVDNMAIGDPVAHFYYVFLNLESHVQAMVLPQLGQAEESNTWDYNTILDQLARVYDNPNKVQEAEDKLLSLHQGTDSVPVYISKFERVLHEARGQNWPDINKISVFRNGLNSTIRNRLNQQLNLPTKYTNFVRIVQQLAGRSVSSSSTVQPQPPNNYQQRGLEPMDISTVAINAMDIPSPQSTPPPYAQSISPAIREQYRLEGRCVRCGSYDHWVGSCSLRPYKKQTAKRIPASDQGLDESDLEMDAEIYKLQIGEA
jgi:hypothetical protein